MFLTSSSDLEISWQRLWQIRCSMFLCKGWYGDRNKGAPKDSKDNKQTLMAHPSVFFLAFATWTIIYCF